MQHVKGNAVTSVITGEVDALVHCCNCHNTFGSGIAKEIRIRIPSAYDADTEFHREVTSFGGYDLMLGTFSVNEHANARVYNIYGQLNYGYGRHINYAAFARGLVHACQHLTSYNNSGEKLTIAVPYLIGCDRAGGDWSIVLSILEDVEKMFASRLLIKTYELEN